MQQTPSWHTLSKEEVLQHLNSHPGGLDPAQAAHRLADVGLNQIQAARKISPWEILLEQFKNVLILILLAATVVSLALGHGVESLAIAVIVLFAVFLGFIQEYRAERSIEALQRMAAPTAAVLRGGEEVKVPASQLVPGDVILLRTGARIPADARLLEALNLQVEEAPLTGESLPVEKHTLPLDSMDLAVGDRKNMVYAGTAITYGRGLAIVVATGMQTEFGKIAQLLQTVETDRTPLQQNLNKVGSILARGALVMVLLIVALGLLRGQPLIEMLIFGIALAVAVVPEALPAVVTISLAIGVQKMVRRNALVRRLPAVETLGSTTVICSDKTGTLTRDEMTVRRLYVAGKMFDVSGSGYAPQGSFSHSGVALEPSQPVKEMLVAAALASDARLVPAGKQGSNGASSHPDVQRNGWEIQGDPTEGALVVAAAKAGLDKEALERDFPRRQEIPFTSESKRMITLHQTQDGLVAYAKGAPEVILESCENQLLEGGVAPLDAAGKEGLLQIARQMAGEALRLMAVAYRPNASLETAQNGLVFLGLAGMIDPPRKEAKAAIATCEQAGIRPVMITGDHPLTAQAVARELGLLKNGKVVTGAELEAMDDEELDRQVETIEVYARVSPAHKLRVVSALRSRGHITAMTGDGVNDAPALKKADIGIAMGITGTDVTREAASMTLTDDNFASIVAAVEEGRSVFNNIKKYLMYLLSSNVGEIGLMASAALLGLPLPLTAVQLLTINLATDGLPALALAVDPPDADLMKRRPRNPRTGIFTRPVVTLMLTGGIWSTLVNLGLFIWALNSGRSQAEAITMTFVSLVLIQFFKAYNYRSDRRSVLERPFANRWLNLAIVGEMAMLLLIVYVPLLQGVFQTFSLTLEDWLIVAGLAFTVSPVLELAKWLERRGWFGKMEG